MLRIAFIGQENAFSKTALAPLLLPYDPRWKIALVVTSCERVGTFRMHKLCMPSQGAASSAPTPHERILNVPHLLTTNINSSTAHDHIQAQRIDMALCVGSDRLFSQETLRITPRGFLNVHPSALPKLRGPCPLFWTVKNGMTLSSVTLHWMDAQEDHGPIIDMRPFKIEPRATYEQLHRAASEAAIPMIRDALLRIVENRLQSIPQEHSLATRARRPKYTDVQIDPMQWDIEPLANFITMARGVRTAWMRAGDETFYFERAERTEPLATLPGSHVRIDDRVLLQCKDGVLHTQIQTVNNT